MLDTPQSVISPVIPQKIPQNILPLKSYSPCEKTVFLTFDDGPLNGTGNVVEVLEEEKVHATMFMVGRHIDRNKVLYQEALSSSYVTIANHTYSHASGKYLKFYQHADALLDDIEHTDTILSKNNKEPVQILPLHPLRLAGRNVFRLPCISCDDCSLKKCHRLQEHNQYDMLSKAGFMIYGWDIEWHFDPHDGRPAQTADSVVKDMEYLCRTNHTKEHNKVILLMHDFMFRNSFEGKEKLHRLISLLKQKGWKFAGIEKYI